MRTEVMEMHLFDADAGEEKALCGGDSSPIELMSVGYYLEERLVRRPVGTVCERCKTLAMPLAEVIIEDMAEDLEDECLLGDAEDCHELLNTLAMETGLVRGPGVGHTAADGRIARPAVAVLVGVLETAGFVAT